MTYSIKEAFYTLQGEGAQSGSAAVFCRFSGCNLWSGLEKDRKTAICRFCDTDFVGTTGINGGKFKDGDSLARHIDQLWLGGHDHKLVVFTGGEPLLQIDKALIDAVHALGFRIAVESNGTLSPPDGIDWLTISPKAGSKMVVMKGDELKLVFGQQGHHPKQFENLSFRHFFLQPMDDPAGDKEVWGQNTRKTMAYVKAHPQWRLSVQSHKYLDIP